MKTNNNAVSTDSLPDGESLCWEGFYKRRTAQSDLCAREVKALDCTVVWWEEGQN